MDPVADSHARILRLNAHLAARAVEGLSAEELWRRPGDGSNAILWILGHVVATRYALAGVLGAAVDTPAWAAAFERGQP